MVIRLRHLLIAFSLSAGLAGCGGSSSNNGFSGIAPPPDSSTPTSTGPVGGTVTPFVPETPQATPPSATTSTETSTPPPKFSPVTRFEKQVPAVQDGAIYATEAGDYDLGSVMVSTADATPAVFMARIHGGLWYPGKPLLASSTQPSTYPVVVLLHGQHSPAVPNYQGYEYLASNLAAQGYVVLSIDANDINAASSGDFTSQSRGQLVLATLDKLKKINDGTQTTNGIALSSLVGKIDLDRVGIMGHSRGGQGINDAIQLNDQRIGVTLTQLRSALGTVQRQRNSWVSSVWFSAPGATKTTGTRQAFLATLDGLLATLRTPVLSDADLSAFLDNQNITLAAGAATGPEAPPKYVFKAAVSLAPTDGRRFLRIANVPFMAMIPTCDGDVRNLNGAHAFDRNRFGQDAADTAPRFQIVVRGANHNFFNSQWTRDDYPDSAFDYCYLSSMTESGIRLAPADQTAVGLFVINSFMRHFVGQEAAFAPYWNGSAPLPAKACPGGRWPCDSRVALTLQTNGKTNGLNNHKVIAPFDDTYGFNQPYDDATSMLHMGDPLDLVDTLAFAGNLHTCATDRALPDSAIPRSCTPLMQPDAFFRTSPIGNRSTYSGGLVSSPNQLLLGLSKPDMPLAITLKEPVVGTGAPSVSADDLSTGGYDTLSFRIAMIRPDLAKEQPQPAQEVTVTLTDSKGVNSPAIKVSDFSDALDSSMGLTIPAGSRAAELLNMVAIPIAAFKPDPTSPSAFDPARLKTLTLKFANAPNDGTKVALTDVQLQIFGRTPH
ncbi:hypothetical protein J2W32_001775 [Variovorax boronicumulans]|uniref:PET hydrolase/cutinase-like domain-containing protein n=1 Tax=Variovorax boronicumulans TaxID=436515 RepID=A0AAW8CW54_9BURK|nr:hypothetical protein [Variovorax boronicumulans]MDP9892920.1 hypothetical protein [Variovorax boronicumulans]MDQ0052733.1 hypothetical protein [Variovorax boronicumulans]